MFWARTIPLQQKQNNDSSTSTTTIINHVNVRDNYLNSSSISSSKLSYSSSRLPRLIKYLNVILFIYLVLGWKIDSGSAKHYSNQFAIHVPGGDEKAHEIAKRHGFTNLGQIGSLKNYYLLEHSHVSKRSLQHSDKHHVLLNDEPEVHWFEQQVEKKRVKRDFSYFEGGSANPYFSSFAPPAYKQDGFLDPLWKEQWYLTGGSKDGFDMNVQSAWKKGFAGKGVVVSILDDGIQTNHPDLILNYDPRASSDINDNDNDPTPQDNGDNKHGTRCAGEVAATAGNNICGVGVAYNASIGGVRMLDGTVNDAVEAKALGLNPDHVDIYSASWGPEDDGKTVDGPGPLARRAFIYGVTNWFSEQYLEVRIVFTKDFNYFYKANSAGRRGLGSIFIWASGNGGRHIDSCNCDGYTNSIFTLSISSATQGGYKPWYLEECASTLATTYSSGTPTLDKSVATVDMDGRLRPDFLCTVEHTGTSASAPLAAGIAALALEANNNLSWRDLQHLVVLTSRPDPLNKEEGWFSNGVGRRFSHKFGYGLMDAGAMVDLAVQWSGVPPQHICKSREIREDREIPGAHLGKVKVYMDVDGCSGTNSEIRFLEHVQCKISLRFFPRGNLRILLTSPLGTTSVLLFERPRDVSSSNFDDWPFLSVHFWGELAHGRWTLEIINSGNRRINQPGILKKWQLILYGTDTNPVRLKGRSLPLDAQKPNFSPVAHPQQYRQVPQTQTQQGQNYPRFIPQDYLYQGASENVPEYEKPASNRSQCSEYWVFDLGICVNSCLDGYYTEGKECFACKNRCKSCSSYNQCNSCEHNLVLFEETCLSNCPSGYFEADSSCEKCQIDNCLYCVAPIGSECVKCTKNKYLYNNKCVDHCPAGYRANKYGECLNCPIACSSCDKNICHSCDHGFKLTKGNTSCVEERPICPSKMFYDEDKKGCSSCGDSCVNCLKEDQCIDCKESTYLYRGSCLKSCNSGLFVSPNRKECYQCPKLCGKCKDSENCMTCKADGFLQNGYCLPQCSDGFYNDVGFCHACFRQCKSCIGPGESDCVECKLGYEYSKGSCSSSSDENNHVASTCGDGYYFDSDSGSCHHCHQTCSRCTGGSKTNCRSCVSPLKLDRGSHRCLKCCTKTSEYDCCHCDRKRYAQSSSNISLGYNDECHFVSRRVSESTEREISSGKWNDSSVLTFLWLSVFSVFIILVVVYKRRQKVLSLDSDSSGDYKFASLTPSSGGSRSGSCPSPSDSGSKTFNTSNMQLFNNSNSSKECFSNKYKPVRLDDEDYDDEDDDDNCIVEYEMDQNQQKVEKTPLVLKT